MIAPKRFHEGTEENVSYRVTGPIAVGTATATSGRGGGAGVDAVGPALQLSPSVFMATVIGSNNGSLELSRHEPHLGSRSLFAHKVAAVSRAAEIERENHLPTQKGTAPAMTRCGGRPFGG